MWEEKPDKVGNDIAVVPLAAGMWGQVKEEGNGRYCLGKLCPLVPDGVKNTLEEAVPHFPQLLGLVVVYHGKAVAVEYLDVMKTLHAGAQVEGYGYRKEGHVFFPYWPCLPALR